MKNKTSYMYNVIISVLMVLFLYTGNSCTNNSGNLSSGKNDSVKSVQSNKEYDSIWISCVGDLMVHGAQLDDAGKNGGYDFTHMFKAVSPYLSFADLTLGNFETVTAGADRKFTGYPTFNSPVEYAEACKWAGFDVLTTANNHCLDRGFYGIEKTIEAIKKLSLYQTGTSVSEEDSEQILIVNVKGLKLAILAYTYGTNGINAPSGKGWSVNYINDSKMKRDVESAKKLGADKIIACVHWGEEYQRQPNSKQKSTADNLFNYGVDIIFGSHPHVIQPMETKTINFEGKEKKVFIIWSMGNFLSNQRKKYTDSGVIINLCLIKNLKTGETNIGQIDFVPTYVSDKGRFSILPVYEAIQAYENKETNSDYYSPSNYSRIKEVWKETTTHLINEECGIYPFEGRLVSK